MGCVAVAQTLLFLFYVVRSRKVRQLQALEDKIALSNTHEENQIREGWEKSSLALVPKRK